MREVTLKIPENKFKFFMELVNQLGFETSEENFTIPDWQKEQLDKALKEHQAGNANYSDWKEVKEDLHRKYNK